MIYAQQEMDQKDDAQFICVHACLHRRPTAAAAAPVAWPLTTSCASPQSSFVPVYVWSMVLLCPKTTKTDVKCAGLIVCMHGCTVHVLNLAYLLLPKFRPIQHRNGYETSNWHKHCPVNVNVIILGLGVSTISPPTM